MANTPEIDVPEGYVYTVGRLVTSGVNVPDGWVYSVAGLPTKRMDVPEAVVYSPVNVPNPMEVEQAVVYTVAAGRVKNFYLRAWTFTIDGHDFYVLHLGENGTIVYDMLTQQWMTWESLHRDITNWKASTGCQWNSVNNYLGNTDAIAGDDTTGMLYWLNPQQAYDNTNGIDPAITQEDFERILTGGLPARGRGTTDCNFVFLTGSLGNPYTGAQVLLRTSDDLGKTWVDNGYITITPGDYSQDVTWMSLGSYGTPGRIFEIVDNGAFERIDSLDMK